MKKRILILSVLTLILHATSWAYDFEVDDIYYNILTDRTCEVTYLKYYSSSNREAYSGVASIPETVTYNGTTYTVTSIGDYAFYRCTGLTQVTFDNSVTEIGDYAFAYCTGLTEITIPESVTEIGGYAFQGCTGLTQVNFNAIVCTSAGSSYRAFYGCDNISTVNFGDNVTIIPDYLCYGLTGLTKIDIPNSVTSIGYEAFYKCAGLTSVTIPNSVTEIARCAFEYCSGLTTVNFNAIACTSAGSSSSSSSRAFYGCDNISTVNFGDDVTIVPAYLCYDCTGLTEVIIPNSVTTIGSGAFNSCTGLTSVTIPNSVITIGGSAFSGCTGLTSVTIGNSVTSIGSSAFSGCMGLTKITIPENMTSIGNSAFQSCTGLTQVNYNATSCTSAGSSNNPVFSGCTGLSTANIGDNVTTIPAYLFKNCIGLEVMNIPSVVESVGSAAFEGCTSLTQVTLQDGGEKLTMTTSSSSKTFTSCPIVTLYLGREVDYTEEYSPFRGITTLTSLTFGERITSISDYEFYGCSGLAEAVFPKSITEIGEYAFADCENLARIVMLSTTPPTIYNNTFDSSVLELEAPKASLREYASDDNWAEIPSIYAISNGNKYYPLFISYEGDPIMKALDGDKEGAIVKEGEDATILPIGTNKELLGTVDYNGRDLTATLIGKGEYSLEVSKYHKDNVVYSHYVDADKAFDITLSQSGELIDMITVSKVDDVYSLRVKGNIDGTDILTIRRLTNLKYLDLSQAKVVSGGYAYYNNYTTSTDTIGKYFFSGLSGLALVKLPDTATTIEDYAFSNCTGLICLHLPTALDSISGNAFSSCSKIEGINSPNPATPDIKSGTFSSVDKTNCVLNVPIGSSSAYWLHTYWGAFKSINEVDFNSIVDTIEDIPIAEKRTTGEADGGDVQIYNLSGIRVKTPIKGNIYIYKYLDGTARKVLVK